MANLANWTQRSERLWGEEGTAVLQEARVAVLGLGGVGGGVAEGLCRAGVGTLLLVDFDRIETSNLNRQLIATVDVVGEVKCQAAAKRLSSINPQGSFIPCEERYLPDNCQFLFDFKPDYVVDAIDMVTSKLHLITACKERGVPLITCLGTGNRLDPSQLRIGDLAETAGYGCALARVMRKELRKQGIEHAPVLYSRESPLELVVEVETENGRHSPGSTPFVPPAAGLLLASHVVRELLTKADVLK